MAPVRYLTVGEVMHSLVRNHPFIDGNKRTAVIAALVFYGLEAEAKGTV